MTPVICLSCNRAFLPRERGYNARYCSDTCKRRSKRARLKALRPELVRLRRARSYQHTKKYPERMQRHREHGRRYRQLGREWLAAYKLSQGCVDCGYRAHAAALQLDHEGPKAVEISEARSSIKRLKTEIEAGLCKVRCANCHSIRTWEQKQAGPKIGATVVDSTPEHGSMVEREPKYLPIPFSEAFVASHDPGAVGKGCAP